LVLSRRVVTKSNVTKKGDFLYLQSWRTLKLAASTLTRRVAFPQLATKPMAATNPNNPDEIPLELTQEEIWDDSTLVETWDEALREYKVPFLPEINEERE